MYIVDVFILLVWTVFPALSCLNKGLAYQTGFAYGLWKSSFKVIRYGMVTQGEQMQAFSSTQDRKTQFVACL